jgi:hypothetical protein
MSENYGVEFFEEKTVADEIIERKRNEEAEGVATQFLKDTKIAKSNKQANYILLVIIAVLFVATIFVLIFYGYQNDKERYLDTIPPGAQINQ